MSINIPTQLLDLKGQCVNTIECNSATNIITIHCQRDKRYRARDPITKHPSTVNCYVRRTIHDLPLLNHQVQTKDKKRRIESCDFFDKGCYYTKRFCRLISGLCRYMTISAVSKHFNVRWETVKNMDKQHLQDTLPALNPKARCIFRRSNYKRFGEI